LCAASQKAKEVDAMRKAFLLATVGLPAAMIVAAWPAR
jgi:hypothetical protein